MDQLHYLKMLILNIDKYKYSGYGIGFDRKGAFSVSNRIGTNVIILGVDRVHLQKLIITKLIMIS